MTATQTKKGFRNKPNNLNKIPVNYNDAIINDCAKVLEEGGNNVNKTSEVDKEIE